MEVRPGYRQTDVGVIPEEWGVARFSELFEFRNGVNADKDAYGKGIPFINVLEVITKGHLRASDIPGKVSLTNHAIDSYAVRRGDLVFNRTSETQEEVGLTAVYLDNQPVVFGGFVIRGRPKTAEVDASFSGYAFRAPSIRSQIIAHGQGAIRANVGQRDLRQILTALPPLPEQQAIAQALSDADALIESLEQLVAKKRQLKQGVMQELLTGKKRLLGFSHGEQSLRPTKFGTMPADWVPTSLERVAAFITKGSTPTTFGFVWQKDGVLFLRSECVSERGLDLSQSMFISDRAHQVLRRSEVRAGDILMTITGNVGRVVHLGSNFAEANINQHIARIRIIDEQVLDTFLFHFLSQPVVRRHYNLITTGQAYPQISLTQVRETEVPIPSFPEQTAIAAVLSEIDADLAALEEKLAKARQLKQGMMHELLTGRIRLV